MRRLLRYAKELGLGTSDPAPESKKAILELRVVTKKYHTFPAVDHVSFVVRLGKSV